MKSTELLTIVAKLLVEIDDVNTELDKINKEIAEGPDAPEGSPIYDQRAKLIAKVIALETQQDLFNEKCAADLYISMFMYCWMLEVCGKPDMDVPTDLSDAAADELIDDMGNRADEFAAKVGGLMPQVRKTMKDLGYMPYETTVSASHWAYGVACDEKECTALTACLRSKFHRAFESGSLTLRKKFFGWHFKVIPNARAAREFLEAIEEHKRDGKSLDTFMEDEDDDI